MVFLPFAVPSTGVFMDAGAVAEAKQKKVTRFRVRQPDSIKCRASDSLMLKQSKFD